MLDVNTYITQAQDALGKGEARRAINLFETALSALRLPMADDRYRDQKLAAGLLNDIANIWDDEGDRQKSIQYWRAATGQDPGLLAAWINLIFAVLRDDKNIQAEADIEQALAAHPRSAALLSARAMCRHVRGDKDNALKDYQAALQADPAHHEAHKGLAMLAHLAGDHVQARHHFRLCKDGPMGRAAEINAAISLPVVPDSREDIDQLLIDMDQALDQLLAEDIQIRDAQENLVLTSFRLTYFGKNDRPYQEKIGRLLTRSAPELTFQSAQVGGFQQCSWKKRDRLRVGFVSACFKRHTITKLFGGLIRHLDKTLFETVLLPIGPWFPDDWGQELANAVDICQPVGDRLPGIQQGLAAAECDILVFCDVGMDAMSWLLVHGRYAPVQCATWGHPMTTGSANMDYFLSCAGMEIDGAEEHYSERLIRLPHIGTWFDRPEASIPDHVRNIFGFGSQHNIYLCPQSLFKIHPDFDAIIADILRSDPDGVLVFLAATELSCTRHLQDRWARRMPDVVNRIRVLPGQNQQGYFHLVAASDVILDTPHFCGGNSTYEILAFGKPVITWGSDFAKGRITETLLRDIDATDGIASSLDKYAGLAARMGISRKRRDRYQQAIRDNAGRLYSNPAGLEDVQHFFIKAATDIDYGIGKPI